MSILKALKKKRFEQTSTEKTTTEPDNVEPLHIDIARINALPKFLLDKNFRIGAPVSTFKGQSDSSIGMALPSLESQTAAGAALNVVSPTPSAPPLLPDFISWNVEAESVEPRLVAITEPHSTYCEEYRSLRTHVLHKSQRQKLQAIVVASINQSEGKSITALNLSWLLAQTDGVRALIIDSDLRRPSLADYLGIETDRGLSEVLAEKSSLKDSIIRLEPAGLHLLPGGAARNDVTELISGPKFKEILRQAREMFDYVIIDAPPLGIFTDATVLINQADGALLVIRANQTRYAALDHVLESLPRERMLGVVLNQTDDVANESHYNYSYSTKLID